MKFTEYTSIENSYREKTINAIVEQGYSNEVVISKAVNKQLNKRCADCIRSIWLNLVN